MIGGVKVSDDNSIIERSKNGQIKRKVLSSERASELGKLSWKASQDRIASVQELLEWAGYPDGESAPPDVRLLVNDAVKSGRSPAATLREIRSLVGMNNQAGGAAPAPGEVCSMCGQLVGDLSGDTLISLLDMLEHFKGWRAAGFPGLPVSSASSASSADGLPVSRSAPGAASGAGGPAPAPAPAPGGPALPVSRAGAGRAGGRRGRGVS